MNCDVGKAMEELDNDVGDVGEVEKSCMDWLAGVVDELPKFISKKKK